MGWRGRRLFSSSPATALIFLGAQWGYSAHFQAPNTLYTSQPWQHSTRFLWYTLPDDSFHCRKRWGKRAESCSNWKSATLLATSVYSCYLRTHTWKAERDHACHKHSLFGQLQLKRKENMPRIHQNCTKERKEQKKKTNQQTNKKPKSQKKEKKSTRKRGSHKQAWEVRYHSWWEKKNRKTEKQEKKKRKKKQSRASFNLSERSWRVDSESAGSARFVSPDSYDSVVSPPCRAMSNPEAVLTGSLRTHPPGFQRIYRKMNAKHVPLSLSYVLNYSSVFLFFDCSIPTRKSRHRSTQASFGETFFSRSFQEGTKRNKNDSALQVSRNLMHHGRGFSIFPPLSYFPVWVWGIPNLSLTPSWSFQTLPPEWGIEANLISWI